MPISTDALHKLLRARSVAIVGASERPGASSGFVVRNLQALRFAGPIIPVHPSAPSVFGLPAVRSLAALPEPVDAIVVAVPAEPAVEIIAQAGDLGLKAAVVLASGFSETGAAGLARQAALVAIAHRNGMALCGPNCLGLIHQRSGLALYSSRAAPMRPGGLAIVSHSGALLVALANNDRLRVSTVVSAGNAAVTDAADYLQFFARDDETRVIGLVLESIADPAVFETAMAACHAADKPVIVLRIGRSAKGAAASAAHTGATAGVEVAYQAFFRRVGALAVSTLDEWIETAILLERGSRATTRTGLGIVGVSGGGLAHVCDVASDHGLAVPPLAEATRDALAKHLPTYVAANNPLDTTGLPFADATVYRTVLDTMSADPEIGLVIAVQDVPCGLDPEGVAEYRGIVESVVATARAGTPVVLMTQVAGGLHPTMRALTKDAPLAVLQGTAAACAALAHRNRFAAYRRRVRENGPLLRPDPTWRSRLASGAPFDERESKAFLAQHGLPMPKEHLVQSATDAIAAATAIGFPVALKIVSPDLPHKSEMGGVRLHLQNMADVGNAYRDLVAAATNYNPDALITGVLVAAMVDTSIEASLGLVRFPPFGLALAAGLGGVRVDLWDDARFALLPVDGLDANALLSATRLNALLDGFRGAPKADRAELLDAMARLAAIGTGYGDLIEAIDLNPVAVLPDGRGVVVLDAMVFPRAKTSG